jgi:hypothetical protein
VNAARDRRRVRDAVHEPEDFPRVKRGRREEVEVLAPPVVLVESREGRPAREIEAVGEVSQQESVEKAALPAGQITERHARPRAAATPPRTARSATGPRGDPQLVAVLVEEPDGPAISPEGRKPVGDALEPPEQIIRRVPLVPDELAGDGKRLGHGAS